MLDEKRGRVLVDNLENPKLGLFSYKFFHIPTGNSKHESAKEILKHSPKHKIIVVPDDDWAELVKQRWGWRLIPITRTKFSSQNLNLEFIKGLKNNLPEGLTLSKIGKMEADYIAQNMEEMEMIIDLFGDTDNFMKKGFGYCVKDGEKIVSVAATGSPPYKKAFEIQVETLNKSEYRRKGLASTACAHLIEYSLENGFDPRWDAADERSAMFAKKMGYTDPEKYEVYIYLMRPLAVLRKFLKAIRLKKIIQFLRRQPSTT